MCGIAGFLDSTSGSDAARLSGIAKAMGDEILHRGPDAHGEFVDRSAGLALSHRRLAILDLTAAGAQPMTCRSGRWVLVFNGEIYNFQTVRADVERARGDAVWRGHSDTEVLVEAIDLWGVEKALQKCDGMFAIAAWNAQNKTLVLARDRLGEKPLYWGRMPDGALLFGSELRALFAHPSWHGELNRDAVGLLMHYNCIPAPHSIFRHVHKLLPGHLLEIVNNRVSEPRPYWSLTDEIESGRASRQASVDNEDEWIDRLEHVLGDVIEEQMISDVPLGAFLSGGIDSSLVVAMMQKRASRPVKTFTIGFKEDGFDEARFARDVAAHLGTEHHELYLTGKDALALVPDVAGIYDEPFSDSSQLPTSLVARFARQHVTVALSGDGGDEMFCGYTRYIVGDGLWRRVQNIPLPLRKAAALGMDCVPASGWEAIANACGKYVPGPLRASPGEKMKRVARILRSRSPVGFYDELISHWKDPSVLVPGSVLPPLPHARTAAEMAGSDIEYMAAHDTLCYLPDDIMVKVDRAAMAVSLETRTPFLDRRVVNLAWQVPVSLKLRDGSGKWLMRQVLGRHVPRHLFERPKQGFGIPLAGWLRGPLREWADELLSPPRLQQSGLLDAKPVQRKWQEHLSGRADWHYYLWDVLMFQQWFERYRGAIAG